MSGVIVLLLFLLMVSVLGRMFIFLRFITLLLLIALVVFGAIVGIRLYFRNDER